MVLDGTGSAAAGAVASAAAAETALVPTASVAAGDVLRVLPGERMPVDGVVLNGRAVADEAMLTGEAALVPKLPGDNVSRLDRYALTVHMSNFICDDPSTCTSGRTPG